MKLRNFLFFLLISNLTFSQKRPNVVVIMADDLGFSDIGCYGSEIPTPNLDKLAAKGVKFTQFYNSARCCPSRAALLTGLYPHQAGMGQMVVTNKIKNRTPETPTQGWLSRQTVTIAEALKASHYQTFMTGKWHVGEEQPDWPLQRGFDIFFGLISGANSYYGEVLPGRQMIEQNEPITTFPKDFYLTDAISDKAVDYIDESKKSENPFFLYVAYTAPHWPIHAPADEIAKFKGKYMKGWEAVRNERFKKQQAIGLFSKKYNLSPADTTLQDWNKTTNKEEWDLKMATYAAMVSTMDKGIGRIIEKLKKEGLYENTMIMFLSDNGACAENIDDRAKKDLGGDYNLSLTATIGAKGSYKTYDKEWASVGNTPFKLYKQYTHEGGIASPMIVHYPKNITKPLQTNQLGYIIDIMPTILELTQTPYPVSYNNQQIKPVEGKSLMPILQNKTRPGHDFIAWKHFDSEAIRQGDWKLVRQNPADAWELYDMKNDRTEIVNLATKMPEKVKNLDILYKKWAMKMGF